MQRPVQGNLKCALENLKFMQRGNQAGDPVGDMKLG